MRTVAAILLFAIAVPWAAAQDLGSKRTMEPPVPKATCRYSRLAAWRQVKADPPIEDLMRFDLSSPTEHRVFFPIGTIVTVSRREGAWSCVMGPFREATSGSPFLIGWMRTDLLGPVEDQEPASKIDHK